MVLFFEREKLATATVNGRKNRLSAIGGEAPTDGANETIQIGEPWVCTVDIEGVADLLFHRWNCEAVEEKGKAAKGSKAKKTDDVESYVWRNDAGILCIPGEYFRQSIIHASKYKQDPRSPRKSAMDLYKAGIVCLTPLASLGVKEWDYIDKHRVTIQRNAITRSRPAMKAGWKVSFDMQVLLPEYIDRHQLNETVSAAGRLVGLADFRPTYGRFQIVGFTVR